MTVNDGKGLFDYEGLIDTLIVDCNELPSALFRGQNVQFCKRIVDMVQKLINLKAGLKSDFESRDRTIEMYRNVVEKNGGDEGVSD